MQKFHSNDVATLSRRVVVSLSYNENEWNAYLCLSADSKICGHTTVELLLEETEN